MTATTIEWTDETWNPTTGCDQVSPGCDHCYAMTMAKRLKGMGSAKYQRDGDPATSGPGFGLTMHPDVLTAPLSWRKPRRVFVNSMSDLFHKDVDPAFIARAFAVMALTPRHTYQVLTKRHARMRALLSDPWFEAAVSEFAGEIATGDYEFTYPLRNVWLGVSVENQKWANIRIPALNATPAAVRFLSAEPLLGPIDLEFIHYEDSGCGGCSGLLSPKHEPTCGTEPGSAWGVDWVITGGESGAGARPFDLDWARSIRDQCVSAGVAYFHKQHGGIRPKSNGRELDGRTWDEMPNVIREANR